MKKQNLILVILLIIFAVLAMNLVGTYNNLVKLDESVNSSWAQVENQLQRRYDLIPNLVNTVKGYAAHEKEVLTEVTEARAKVGSAQTIPDKINANGALTSALGRLMVVMERYPDLKANQNFLSLQSQLEGTENRIAVERRRFNKSVETYNGVIRTFPNVLIASITGFDKKEFFKSETAASKAPEVKF